MHRRRTVFEMDSFQTTQVKHRLNKFLFLSFNFSILSVMTN